MSLRKKILLCFIASQGAGKQTQGAVLTREFRFPHLDMGDYLRGLESRAETDLKARKALETIDGGNHLKDADVNGFFDEYFAELDGRNPPGLIIDGFPRSAGQTSHLLSVLPSAGYTEPAVIYFKVRPDTARARIKDRVMKARTAGVPVRKDDEDDEKIERRLAHYEQKTLPIVQLLRESGIQVFEIDGEPKPEIVSHKLVGLVSALIELHEEEGLDAVNQ